MQPEVNVEVVPGIQPIINATISNLSARDDAKVAALININLSAPEELTAEEYERLLDSKLKDWINPPRFKSDLNIHLNRLYKSSDQSAAWIFQHELFIQWWSFGHSGNSQPLWIAGRPGAGKSVIAANLVQTLSKDADGFVGYAFGSKNEEAKKQTSALIRSIIWQMLTRMDLELDKKRQMVAAIRRSPAELDDILEQHIAIFGKCTLIFDGLDECILPKDFIERMLKMADKLTELRIIFVSQKTPDISDALRAQSLMIDMESNEVRISTDEDILAYVKNELEKKASSYTKQPQDERQATGRKRKSAIILEKLDPLSAEITNKANGMFLWAVVAVPDIIHRFIMSSEMDYHELVKSINNLPDSNDMNEMFNYLLHRITHADPSGPRDAQKWKRYLLIMLRWVFHAVRPLTLEELQTAIGLEEHASPRGHLEISTGESPDMDFLDELARAAYPLVVFQEKRLTVLHSSFRDFVYPTAGQSFDTISGVLGDKLLLEGFILLSIQYLQSTTFDFETCISGEKAALGATYPFYDYACLAWVTQVQTLQTLPEYLQDSIVEFFKTDTVITWLEQWRFLANRGLRFLQGTIYRAVDKIKNPMWCVALLVKCCGKRMREDEGTLQTFEMSRDLSLTYQDGGMLDAALQGFKRLLDQRQQFTKVQDFKFLAVENDVAGLYARQGKYEEAIKLYRELVVTHEKKEGKLGFSTLLVQAHIGGTMTQIGRAREAESLLVEVYDKQLRALGDRDSATLNTLNNLVINLLAQGKFQQAKERGREERRLYMQIQDKTDSGALLAAANIASAERGLGNYEAALGLQQFVCAARMAELGPEHPRTLTDQNNMATILKQMGRHGEALEIMEEVVRKKTKVFGENHVETLTCISNLAVLLCASGKVHEAIPLEEKVLLERTSQLGERHNDTLITMCNLANIYTRVNRWDEAQDLVLRAYPILLETLGEAHPYSIMSLAHLASVCKHRGFLILATWLTSLKVEAAKTAYDEANPLYIDSLWELAEYQRLSGNFEGALRTAKLGKKLGVARFGKTNWATLGAKNVWAATMRIQGDLDAAESMFEEIRDAYIKSKGKESEDYLRAMQSLAITHYEQQRVDLAVAELREIQSIASARTPETSDFLVGLDVVLSDALSESGEFEESEALATKALEFLTKTPAARKHDAAKAMESLAKALRGQSRLDESRDWLVKAIKIRIAHIGSHHAFTLIALDSLSQTLELQGMHRDAAYLMQLVVESRERILSPEHPRLLRSKSTLEEMMKVLVESPSLTSPEISELFQGETPPLPEVVARYEQARDFLGANHPLTIRASFDVGIYHRDEGRPQEAEEWLRTVMDAQLEAFGDGNISTLKTMVETGRLCKGALREPKRLACLHRALDRSDVPLLRELLDAGADPSYKDTKINLTALGHAVKVQNEAAVKELLDFAADVNYKEDSGDSALHMAASAGNRQIIKTLLGHGADSLAQNSDGRSVLLRACHSKDEAVIKQMLEAGARPEMDRTPIPALHTTAMGGSVPVMELLLQFTDQVNLKQEHGFTPFLAASFSGELPMMRFLLERGADLHSRTNEGQSAFDLADKNGHAAAVKFLVEKGLGPTKTNGDG